MTEARTVWAVSDGEYSDYRVRAIFETEADAEAAKERGLGSFVESFVFYPEGVVPRHEPQWIARARVSKYLDKDPGSDPWATPEHLWPELEDGRAVVRRAKVTMEEWPNGGGWWIQVISPSQKGALKVCADRVAKLKAEALEPQPEPECNNPGCHLHGH